MNNQADLLEQPITFSNEKMIGFRNELIRVLDSQIKLLYEMESVGLVPKHTNQHDLVIDDKHLPEMVQLLEGEKHKLKNFDVILAVVGTMKAGKSTTINAIVGKEIMPNRNRPMTAVPTLICHKKGQLEPSISFDSTAINACLSQIAQYLKENPHVTNKFSNELKTMSESIISGFRFKNNCEGTDLIFEVLANFNDLVRLISELDTDIQFPFDCYREINQLPVIDVEFGYLKNVDESTGRLMLLDTPGPNEAKQPHLKTMLEEQLKRSSAVVLILDYTQLKSDAEAEVRDQLDRIPRIDENRLYAFVNKFDQKNANADDADKTKKLVSDDLMVNRIKIDRVYPISAQDAYLANRMSDYIYKHGEKPQYNKDNWIGDFAKKAFGRVDEDDWDDYSDKAITKRIGLLLEDSNIQMPMEQVIVSANNNAPFLAIQSALIDVKKVFDDIRNVFSINGYFSKQVELNEQDLKNIQTAVTQMKKDKEQVLNLSKKLTNEFKTELGDLEKKLSDIKTQTESDTQQKTDTALSKMREDINNSWNEAEEKYKKASSLKSILFADLSGPGAGKNRRQRQSAAENLSVIDFVKNANQQSKDLGKLTLSNQQKDTFIEMMNQVAVALSDLANERIKGAVSEHLSSMQSGFDTIQNSYKESFDSIKRQFSNEGIQLHFELPNHFEGVKHSVGNINIHESAIKTKEHRKTVDQSGGWGWFKRKLAVPFGADWGTDDVEYQTHEIDLKKISKQIQETIDHEIIKPTIVEAQYDVKMKSSSLDKYALSINQQVESLLNELETAIENEQLPYAEKAERKEHLKMIAGKNESVAGSIEMIQKAFQF